MCPLIASIVTPSVYFQQAAVPIGGNAELAVLIDSLLPSPLALTAIRVLHKDLTETAELKGDDLVVAPGQCSKFVLPFTPPKRATEVEVHGMSVEHNPNSLASAPNCG